MTQRIYSLAKYHFLTLLTSTTGLLLILGALVFYQIFFQPGQRTPEGDYLLFVMGIFGAIFTFIVTLTIAGKANEAESYIFFIRLPSRPEYLAGIFVSSLAFGLLVQTILTLLAIVAGKTEMTLGLALQIPPVWLTINILSAMLAFHASDFASSGWSRVVLFGGLLLLLFTQGRGGSLAAWLAERFLSGSGWFYQRGWSSLGDFFQRGANWFYGSGGETVSRALGALFWPVSAIIDGIVSGSFQGNRALAPFLLLLYATLLFLLAADLLAGKDLYLTEQ